MENPFIKPDTFLKEPRDIFLVIREHFLTCSEWDLKREHFFAIALDSNLALLGVDLVSKGTSFETIVLPAEAFRLAIIEQAKYVVFAHNHPSGNLAPSKADEQITKRLATVGKILGIEVLDHIIFSSDRFSSILDIEDEFLANEADKKTCAFQC